jgi:hypothetical protein
LILIFFSIVYFDIFKAALFHNTKVLNLLLAENLARVLNLKLISRLEYKRFSFYEIKQTEILRKIKNAFPP